MKHNTHYKSVLRIKKVFVYLGTTYRTLLQYELTEIHATSKFDEK